MDSSKTWWQSKTIWGALVAGVSVLISVVLHRTLNPDQQGQIVDAIIAIVGALGTLVSVYGRVNATTQIGSSQ